VREAFLRGISTRQVGRVIASSQLGPLSAQTVSRLSRSLDSLVQAFHQSRIADEWAFTPSFLLHTRIYVTIEKESEE
jgi:transposase-like protein